jgi:hypothetical protein
MTLVGRETNLSHPEYSSVRGCLVCLELAQSMLGGGAPSQLIIEDGHLVRTTSSKSPL